ncbi:MAG: type II toxin-antitoxin system RelE/ParE family toxin [Lachnospiraceae bacterium]
MYEVIFYEDRNGKCEFAEFLHQLRKQAATAKDARINFNKVVAYIDVLEEMGIGVGEPVTKHLDGEIWELRPLRNRILYAFYQDNKIIVLHHFMKKTRKTPRKEINRAKQNLKDFLERKGD